MALLVKNLPGPRDAGSIPASGGSPRVVNGNPLQYSYLENSMDRKACWATVHGVAKSQTRLRVHAHTYTFILMELLMKIHSHNTILYASVCVCAKQVTHNPTSHKHFFLTIGNIHFKHLSVNIYREMAI